MSAPIGAYVELLVSKWARHIANDNRLRPCKPGERGKCTGVLSSPEGAIWIKLDDEYYTAAGANEYRVLSPLEELANVAE